MEPKLPLNTWVKTSAICGLTGGCLYLLAAFVDMHPALTYIAAYTFPILLALGCAGLFYYFSGSETSGEFRTSWLSVVAGTLLVIAMMAIQQSIFSELQRFPKANDGSVNLNSEHVSGNLQSILKLVWVMLISLALIMFSVSMRRQNWSWKITGTIGLILGVLLLFINGYYYIVPPVEPVAIGWGQLVALWLLFVFATLLTSKVKLQHETVIAEGPSDIPTPSPASVTWRTDAKG